MLAYRYNEQNIYIGQEEAFIDPLESKKSGKDIFVLPANCTFIPPQEVEKDGCVQMWNGSAWEYVENHIGRVGYVDGKPYEVKEYGSLPAGWSDTPPPPTKEEFAEQVRAVRNAKIAETDYLLTPDYPISAIKLEEVKAYRKALRDITAQAGFPNDVVWPTKPEL